MKQHLLKQRQVEAAIRTELLRKAGENAPNATQRVLIELLDLRIATLDKLIAELEAEATTSFVEAMERIRKHFDKDEDEPYRAWRGATPFDQPSLSKDIRAVFEELIARGVWLGKCPVLDPRWNPSA